MVIDAHVHLTGGSGSAAQRVECLLRFADRLGIDRFITCLGPVLRLRPAPDELRADNDFVMAAVAACPDRVAGLCYGSPAYPEATVAEMERCIAQGPLRGVKLWVCRRCDDPGCDPIAQKAGELGVPVLQHTWIKATGNMPTESRPEHLVGLARRHPGTTFIMAHSGGDWQRGLRLAQPAPNILVDTCGGNPEQGQVELAVRLLGAERVLYGSDADGRSFASQLAKVTAARVTEAERRLVLGENAARVVGAW
jgi:uncharacterized protein